MIMVDATRYKYILLFSIEFVIVTKSVVPIYCFIYLNTWFHLWAIYAVLGIFISWNVHIPLAEVGFPQNLSFHSLKGSPSSAQSIHFLLQYFYDAVLFLMYTALYNVAHLLTLFPLSKVSWQLSFAPDERPLKNHEVSLFAAVEMISLENSIL